MRDEFCGIILAPAARLPPKNTANLTAGGEKN